MKKMISLILTVFALISTAAFAEDPIYPFNVKLNGETAVKNEESDIFAAFSHPVPANAAIEVEATGQVIVNAFPCDEKGNPIAGQAPAILMFQAPKSSLAQTIDGKGLTPGKYLANVVAENKTSRIVFDIE